jgi:ABC-type polysaccharide/polyol phosphate export permease
MKKRAFQSFLRVAIRNMRLAGMLGWQDLLQTYRRSALGPFWLTAGMGVQIAVIGVVFGTILKSAIAQYLPLVATGVIFWGFITVTLNEAALAFIAAEPIIRQLPLPMFVHTFRVVWKNLLVLAHNLAIVPIVYLVIGIVPNWAMVLVLPGTLLVTLNLAWIGYLLGMVSARYRDIPPIVQALLLVGFYVTPVMWSPNLLPTGVAHFLLGLNPFYHLLQVARLPAMGQLPTTENWLLSTGFLIFGAALSRMATLKYAKSVPFWV